MIANERQLQRAAPYFPVHNVEKVAEEYERVFGFSVEYLVGNPAEFAIVSRDGLPLMFRRVPSETLIAPNATQGGSWDVFFWVRDARKLYGELKAAGASIVYEPTLQESYHMLEFAVRDRNGYVLGFGEPQQARTP